MQTSRLLAGTLALFLVAGLGTPVFGDFGLEGTGTPPPKQPLAPQVIPPNVIYDNGGPNLINAANVGDFVSASDFVIADDMVLTDVHLWMCEQLGAWDGTIEWWIFEDAPGSPGTIFAEGNGVLVDKIPTGDVIPSVCDVSELSFDLDNPVGLEGGITYWLGLHLKQDFSPPSVVFWATADPNGSLLVHASSGGTFDNWFAPGGGVFDEVAFFLTGDSTLVGGELLPIDNTALVLAGIQTSAIWMLPVLAGVAGAGFYLVKFRMNKE